MPFFTNDLAADAKLNFLKDNTDKIVLTVGEPTSFANANAVYGVGSGQKVVEAAVDASDFTLADGSVDGRKVTAAEQADLTPVEDGDATYVAWLDTVNSRINYYAPLSEALSVTTSGLAKIPAHAVIDRDPIAVT